MLFRYKQLIFRVCTCACVSNPASLFKGFLVTGLLRRLRYILEVVRLGPAEVQLALEIITRISRHSSQAAAQVYRSGHCDGLLTTVVTVTVYSRTVVTVMIIYYSDHCGHCGDCCR